ncbi:hypothetical protein QBC37DRAFT_476988 [Rhypophila decipiens]|uniref:ORC1/DEAH AAA+ ATPase domain-containing protein n=1 Tax=Rhypophila decipiens TaxID=261697 RepID=A0AAN6XTD9_9PEZI|nr:hypothetical protein QBC37DRAFT_476988 [Rhypophila decipiens]
MSQYVVRMKRLLPLRKAAPVDQDEPPNRLSREIFPSGIRPLHSPDNGAIDIVFVHGLTGNRDNTWTARDSTEPWPRTLLPSVLTTARVLTFGYDAYVADWRGVVSQNRIANHAWNLLSSLASYREHDDTALVTSRQRPEQHLQNILRSTCGIVFLGTPHHGAGLARWAELLSRSIGLVKQTNSKIIEVLRRDSEVLARIQDSFHTMIMARSKEGLPPIEITCFYEELPLPGVGVVVPKDSAILPGYIPIGIQGNHRDMAKFTGPDDPGFVAVCGELRRWIRDANAAERRHVNPLPSRDLDMEGQPGTADQFGDGNRMFASFGGLQKNIEGGNYESGGGVMNIVNNINRVSAEESAASSKVSRVIPLPRNEDMVDRTHIFARLDALLPPKSDYQSAALCGLGGSGKTQVALEYAYNRCRDPACSVFWVHADNETTFAQDYKSIARRLGLAKLDGEKLLTAVRERIKSGPPWLLVLDNADDLALFGVGLPSHNTSSGRPEKLMTLYNYVPSSGTGTVLWTSRDERIVGTLVGSRRGIQVGPMSPGEAKILLGTSRNEEVASKEAVDAEKLLQELQWLPLAISQAGAYLRRTSTPITEYLSKLAEERWQTLKETEFDRHRRPNIPNSVLETWNISIKRIRRENKMAYRIMHIIAYVNNQDIPFEIMAAAGLFGDEDGVGDPGQNKDRVVKAVTRLKEFSFLRFLRGVDDTRSYEMHKLVQEATRYELSVRNPENEIHFSECERYIAHAVQVGEWAEVCNRKVEVSDLLTRISNYLYDRGRWREKEPVDQRAYELRREVLGEKHPDTIRSMADLATTYHAQGRYAEAEPMKINVLDLRREVLGEKHPDTIGSMAELAATYHQQGRYAEAEPIDIKVLELRRDILGEKHPDTIGSMADLAITWNSRGRRDDAIGLMNKCLQLRQTVLGSDHPFTEQSAQTLNSWKNG